MKLFSRTSPMRKVSCADVVDAYGAVLEKVNWQDSSIVSEDKLPFDKSIIKEALVSLAFSGNSKAPISTLKAGFIELGSFQYGMNLDGITSKMSSRQPKTRDEIAAFFRENGPKLKSIVENNDFLLQEASRLANEWDARLRLMKELTDA